MKLQFKAYLESSAEQNFYNIEWFNSIKDLIESLKNKVPEELRVHWPDYENPNQKKVGRVYDVFGTKVEIVRHNMYISSCIIKNLDTGEFAKVSASYLEQVGTRLSHATV